VAKTAASETGWFVLLKHVAGTWGIGFAVLAVFAASMGWIDGAVQVSGTQIANDIIGGYHTKSDGFLTKTAKIAMVGYMLAAAVVAYATFNYAHLINLAIMSYQGIIQLAVPIFFGLWWKGGNRQGALGGLVCGFVVAASLTYFYPSYIPWLGGLTAGLVGLAVNLAVFLGSALIIGQSKEEKSRVSKLFAQEQRMAQEKSGYTV
jgi:SSS family solute:Na+ symporter